MCAAVKINRIGKFDLNPRGNLWLKDENRFGHKLLSKMGWSQGMGLGKNGDGIAENVKVKIKTSNTGVGWTEKIPIAMKSDEYDAVLATLNEKFKTPDIEAKKENNIKSLEDRSQQFKNRLHYGKFVKGKDVCQYSEKDLNSIFIMKKSKTEPKLVSVKSSVTNIESSPEGDDTPESVPTFKSQMSMKEYFENKLKKKSLELQNRKIDSEETNVPEELHSTNENLSKKKKKALVKEEKLRKGKLELDESISAREDKVVNESCVVTSSTDSLFPVSESVEQLCDDIPRKKRKKSNDITANRKKLKLDIPEELESQNELNNDVILIGKYASPEVQFLGKRKKKLKAEKHKSSKVKYLKSCLKSNLKYSLEQKSKEVSFNEQVFFRVLDSSIEDIEVHNKSIDSETNCHCDSQQKIITNQVNSDALKKEFSNVLLSDTPNEINSVKNEDESCQEELQDSEDDSSEVPKCLDLPKCDKSNYDSWLENQRMAIKMKLYKNMVRKMKKHPVLRTTNLIHIKGYGNWGF